MRMDAIDRRIIQLVQEEPNLTHTEIAKKVNRSQPTVGMRIRKLEESGVLQFQAGINMKMAGLSFARVEVQTLNPQKIIKLVQGCPYMLNAFRLSGDTNISILIAGNKLSTLDKIVNYHFRNNPAVSSVSMDIITEIVNDFVLPIDLSFVCCDGERKECCCKQCEENSII